MEILRQHTADLEAVFVPVGGGGLIAGVAAYVKYVRPDVKVVGVEPDDAPTLHAALGHINQPGVKIWTAEDPVEITQRGLRQVQVKPKIGFDFAAAMRAFLRADPEVIMVGEIRDRPTAEAAIGMVRSCFWRNRTLVAIPPTLAGVTRFEKDEASCAIVTDQ